MQVLCEEYDRSPPAGGQADPQVMAKRLADVRADCLHVVRELSDGRLTLKV